MIECVLRLLRGGIWTETFMMTRDPYLQVLEQRVPAYTEQEQNARAPSKLGTFEDKEEGHVGGSRASMGTTA